MKVIQSSNERLEIANSSYLWGSLLALWGGVFFCNELSKFIYSHQNWRDFHADVPVLASVLFILVGLFLCQRYHASFDKRRHELVWTRSTPFGTTSRTILLRKVTDADYEINSNQVVNDHPKWGPKKRVVIRTEEGNLPMASLYTYGSTAGDGVVSSINRFLGRSG